MIQGQAITAPALFFYCPGGTAPTLFPTLIHPTSGKMNSRKFTVIEEEGAHPKGAVCFFRLYIRASPLESLMHPSAPLDTPMRRISRQVSRIAPVLCGMRPLRAGCSSVAVLWSPGSFLYQTLTIFKDSSKNPEIYSIHYAAKKTAA